MTGYFRPRQNFQFEKSSIEWWLKSKKKKKGDWKTCVNFGLEEFKIFIGQLSELEFLRHISFMVENFLGSQKLKISKNEKRKQKKMKNELIKIN